MGHIQFSSHIEECNDIDGQMQTNVQMKENSNQITHYKITAQRWFANVLMPKITTNKFIK